MGMVAIFSYGFPIAQENFNKAGIGLEILSNYNALIEEALQLHYIEEGQVNTLKNWREDPANWKLEAES